MTTLDEKIEAAKALTGYTRGPWKWWTSNSWRRLKHDSTGLTLNILEPFVARDGHPDCSVSAEDQDLIAAAPDLHRLALDLAAERERLLALALKAFTVVEWAAGEGFILEYPHEDADDLLLEMVESLGVESSAEARAALNRPELRPSK